MRLDRQYTLSPQVALQPGCWLQSPGEPLLTAAAPALLSDIPLQSAPCKPQVALRFRQPSVRTPSAGVRQGSESADSLRRPGSATCTTCGSSASAAQDVLLRLLQPSRVCWVQPESIRARFAHNEGRHRLHEISSGYSWVWVTRFSCRLSPPLQTVQFTKHSDEPWLQSTGSPYVSHHHPRNRPRGTPHHSLLEMATVRRRTVLCMENVLWNQLWHEDKALPLHNPTPYLCIWPNRRKKRTYI